MAGMTRRGAIFAGGVLLVGGAIAGRYMLREPNYTAAWYETEDGVAIRGTDPVSYFTDGKPVTGSADHALEWGGTTWHFASADNRTRFEQDPASFAPQYGGYCAWAVGARKSLAPTEPEQWAIVDGKLYLNFNASVQDRWKADVPGFIAKGDVNWPELEAGLL